MKIVEISASLGNGLKRYNTLTEVSMSKQPFTYWTSVLYGVTKGTDIIQTNAPTNILIDNNGNPIDDSEPVYFGIRVYPFISVAQDISCNNNIISYGEVSILYTEDYFSYRDGLGTRSYLPEPYEGKLYPQPEFVESLGSNKYKKNPKQAMQQFRNDCVFPTPPNLDIPGQSYSSDYVSAERIPYFNEEVVVLSELNQRNPEGVLSLIQETDTKYEYEDYMVKFDGQNLNFKFGMATNSDFAEPPNIYLPYLYRTYAGLLNSEYWIDLGVIMQCLLYDSNGNVISA